LPIWVTDFVLGNVGTGAVVGVPGHDLRDFQFAKTFGLEVIRVVVGLDGVDSEITEESQVQEEKGKMINSDFLDGLDIHEATVKIMDYLEQKGWGKRVTTYHLRDWLISRQRYWGPPIPIIYCDKCGMVPVPEKDLPVELPYVENFRPMGTGQSPLAEVEEFYKVKCPNCGGEAKRETDVSDVFVDSAWYFFRYPSTDIENEPFDRERTKKWLPVDSYIGGAEHAVLHLLYSRFITMVLKDAGLIEFEEPYKKFRNNGLITREGAKMSKSKGNVVNPDEYIAKWGADTLRMHLLFSGVYTEGGNFQDSAVNGIYRFTHRIWNLFEKVDDSQPNDKDLTEMYKTVKKITEAIEEIKFNVAIAALMEWLNYLSRKEKIAKQEYKTFLALLAPFAPHITEELWEMLGEEYSIHTQKWPEFDASKLTEDKVKVVVQINSKVRDVIEVNTENAKDQSFVESEAKKSPKVAKFLEGVEVKKVIYVPSKVLNFVVGS
jgi:leucyl-tRNA synthetase